MLGKGDGFDEIQVAAQARRLARSSSRRSCARTLGPHGRRAHRPGAGRQAVQGHPRQPRVPEDLAARVRRHRAVRRRVPDLQHLLDHRRPADARVRAAAHARRLAPPGAARGPRRGPAARRRRRRRRLRCSASGPRRSCGRCSRRSAPTCPSNGRVIETRTVIVSLLVGHGREPRRQHRAGAARHARAAGGGAARGRRADAARPRAADGHRRRAAARDRRGAHVRRPLRQPEVRQRRDLVHGRRRRADLPRRRAAHPAAGAAAGGVVGRPIERAPASPAGSPARTRCASRAAPRSPPRR